MDPIKTRTWAEISLDHIAHNYWELKRLIGADCRYLGVVKANSYGHGAIPVARLLQDLGADYFSVACLQEAIQLRKAGIKGPILIFGDTPIAFADALFEYGLTQTVYSMETAQALSQKARDWGKTLQIHIKVDTGMSRLGFLCQAGRAGEAAAQIAPIGALPGLHAEGIYTHFANADGDEAYTMDQFTRFLELIEALEREVHMNFEIRHCASSSAVIHYPCTHLDMVRPGLALYGLYPTEDAKKILDLRPAMELKSRIMAVRTLPEGAPVSYGCTHVMTRESRVAVLPIGYADGLHRTMSDRLPVLIRGRRAMQIGRICMDLCMVDVTDIPGVEEGDVATLFGRDGDAVLPVEEMADLAGTISYEMVCAPTSRVPRVYRSTRS